MVGLIAVCFRDFRDHAPGQSRRETFALQDPVRVRSWPRARAQAYNLPNAGRCGCVNGNEGMRELADELRGMGFEWGSYNAMGGCDNVSGAAILILMRG